MSGIAKRLRAPLPYLGAENFNNERAEAADEIERLEEALAWYADEANWNEVSVEECGVDYAREGFAYLPIEADRGERARKVLGGGK